MSTAAPQRQKISRDGLLLIKSFEGFRPRAVRRRDGVLAIGYGHTRSAREGVRITEAEAELLLIHDLLPVVSLIHQAVARPLSQHQFDALASFIFNIGVDRFLSSDVLERLNAGATAEAAAAMSGWPDRAPPPVDAPYRRRSAERALFDTPDAAPAPLSALLTAPVARPGADPADTPLGTPGVLRHEAAPVRAERQGRSALALALGAGGLVSAAAAAAAFRRAIEAPAAGQSVLVGGALAIIALALIAAALRSQAARPAPRATHR